GGHVGDEVPNPSHGTAPAGVDQCLVGQRVEQRVVARGEAFGEQVEYEADPFGVAPVQLGVGEQSIDRVIGGQVGLHRCFEQRVALPCRVGKSLVTLGRCQVATT